MHRCLTQLRQTDQLTSSHQYTLQNENIRCLRSHAKSLLCISKCVKNDVFFKSGPNVIWLDANSDLCSHQPRLYPLEVFKITREHVIYNFVIYMYMAVLSVPSRQTMLNYSFLDEQFDDNEINYKNNLIMRSLIIFLRFTCRISPAMYWSTLLRKLLFCWNSIYVILWSQRFVCESKCPASLRRLLGAKSHRYSTMDWDQR